jgi:hypothetical protein
MGMVIKDEILKYEISKILEKNDNLKLEEIYFVIAIIEKEFYKIYNKRLTNIPITYYKSLDITELNKILSNNNNIFKEISILERSMNISSMKMYYIYFHNKENKYETLPEEISSFLSLEEYVFLQEYIEIFLKDITQAEDVYKYIYESYINNVLGELSSYNDVINENEDFVEIDIILNYELLLQKLQH